MLKRFPEYTTDYIAGIMSLRKPQKESLEILAKIVDSVKPDKQSNKQAALKAVHNSYPTCSDFERDFISLTFALATGVGKTRLMGAFIAYLYTNYGIKNFFVTAPNTTIYSKLKQDLGMPHSEKYVLKGLGCFSSTPVIIADEDYRYKNLELFDSDIRIFIFNIDKFNKERAKMRSLSEYLGTSFFGSLASMNDLVLIMDESHHYRAERGVQSLNELKPILGLELTVTPYTKSGTKQINFKNVVYEYPLSKAIADGYTRTPFAVTRQDIQFFNFGEEEIDKVMLNDGILCHERAKLKLEQYAQNTGKRKVKPFMLIVCKDTAHAEKVQNYLSSDSFKDGAYKGKIITVHSNQRGSESEENMKFLLEVEKYENPIEIVIHVNMLKEGWDVNNLYTIVPLRQAASKILREQMVGRGLRLPYGERTGNKEIDMVMLTAHDKFAELLEEAQKGDSIFKAENIIKAEDITQENLRYTQVSLQFDEDAELEKAYRITGMQKNEAHAALFKDTRTLIQKTVGTYIRRQTGTDIKLSFSSGQKTEITQTIKKELSSDKDLSAIYTENADPLASWISETVSDYCETLSSKYIPIPHITVTDSGLPEYHFADFDLDLEPFNHTVTGEDILIQNLEDQGDRLHIKGSAIDFEAYNPLAEIMNCLCEKSEIDYRRSAALLQKLVIQVCSHYRNKYSENGMRNIAMMNKKDIADKIHSQLMKHFYCEEAFLEEKVSLVQPYNLEQAYNYSTASRFFDSYDKDIQSVVFTGIKKGVFEEAKFDSKPELILARIMEQDQTVQKWLRPAKKEFNLQYNGGKHYEPDFVAETSSCIYLIEVKGEDKQDTPDVIAKKNRAVRYCKTVSEWIAAHKGKPWKHLFIPSMQISPSSSFTRLAKTYTIETESTDIYKPEPGHGTQIAAER
ncbi:DEAD/DEAH box helicase [Treponema sp. OMZ 857]|uniref:DEAD/DEAH box helicase n=1 Tax=Treponema sp. OMZ 857 TaxID=1643513 RepID=UPI0020A38675|nr:DEAD/DEAH box helicase family protein [Treponema sp. OMZ 857]UTC44342.1 DEAD/DEAH box helicase family protein [Treponema sp. OMZ 857]